MKSGGEPRAFRGLQNWWNEVGWHTRRVVDVDGLAAEMWAVARVREQCARRVMSDADADAIRARIRHLAATDGIKIRTARMADTVVVVRLDAKVWSQDAATMRKKLAPPER